MNRRIYSSVFATLACLTLGLLTSCSSSSKPAPVETLAVASGSGQSAVVSAAFGAPLVATVTTGGTPNAGVSVTFTAPASGASGVFTSSGTATETDVTDASGRATSSVFTANATAGGPYNVVASATGLTSVNFAETNTTVAVVSSLYSFYLSGQEEINGGPNYYALAGSVQIDSTGNVLSGEQDYNDAFGLTSVQPAGDTISSGTLTVDPSTGQGTLTLNTSNTSLGVAGTETLGVQFVNTNHALIVQFDGSATSSGGMDVQTLPSTLGGGYAFTLSGVDPGYAPIGIGGVFSISGTSLTNGFFDVNDSGTVSTNNSFSATASAPDSFGRGTITGAFSYGSTPIVLNYYIVGPEVMRIIDVDAADSAIGSAFGQGTNGTAGANTSLGSSVFAIAGNAFSSLYGAVGQFSTSSTSSDPALLSGVGEDDELDHGFISALASPIAGTYSIGLDGYGSLTITGGLGGGSVSALGLYMTDPTLNLNDPNNTSTGLGGGLVLDLDASLAGGTGVVIPQTDTATASFAGNYAVGWQAFDFFTACTNNANNGCEFDMVAQGSMTAGGALSLTGLVSDPLLSLGTPDTTSSGDTFSGTPLADSTNAGRYSMLSTNTVPNSLATAIDGGAGPFDLVMYQASGGQLFWLNYDPTDFGVFLGPLEQQGSLSGLPLARGATVKPKVKRKQ